MPIETAQGGHIDTPQPERHTPRRRALRRMHTPDPAHESQRQAAQSPEPRIWQLRQRPNPYLSGRGKVLQQIETMLGQDPFCHLLAPLGAGTSQAALAFAFHARSRYDAVFWLDAGDPLLLQFDISQLSGHLGDRRLDELGHRDRVDAFQQWLATNDRWLVIADNVADFAWLKPLLPENPAGHVLLTGHRDLKISHLPVLELPAFTQEGGVQYLAERCPQSDTDTAERVVAQLGESTLALQLACAYCQLTKTPLAAYDDQLAGALASRDGASPTPPAVIAAVKQCLHYVSEHDPAALELMALCAHFHPEYIPLVSLYDGAPFLPKRLSASVSDPTALNRILTLLFRLGLVQFEQNSISIHPQVQTATRILLGRDQDRAWLMTALRVVLESFPVESQYTGLIPACSVLVRHALTVSKTSESAGNLKENTGTLLSQLGLYLHACGELDAACNCFERAIALAEALHGTAEHPTVASRTNSLGVVLQDQRRFEEARACYQRAFDLCEAIYGPARDAALGPAHRSMLIMPSRNLCQVLELMGDIPAAKAAYNKAIEIFMDVYCWNHSVVAESLNRLGQLHHSLGETGPAQQCFQKAVQAEENADQPELGALAHYMRNLAHCLVELDLLEDAHEYYQHALDCDREDFGPAHESVALDLQGMARVHRGRSRFEEAHRCLDEALSIWNAVSEGPAIQKAHVWRQKGRCYLDANDYDDSIRCFAQALKITSAVAGPDSSGLGPDYLYMGRAFGKQEKHEDSETALREALRIHNQSPWLDNEGLSALYSRLVRAYRAQQNFSEAAVYQKLALEEHQARFGPKDDRVGADAYSLGNLYLALGERENTLRYLGEALDIYTGTRGPEDERTLRVRRKLDMVRDVVARRLE